jgi:hypothetical protein
MGGDHVHLQRHLARYQAHIPMMDDVSTAELAMHVERLHRAPAKFVESVEVKETFEGRTVWEGAVKVFALTGHAAGATRVYAWVCPTGGGKRRFMAVLGLPPVDGPVMAVRTSIPILADLHAKRD